MQQRLTHDSCACFPRLAQQRSQEVPMTLGKAIATLIVSLLLQGLNSCAEVYVPLWDGGDGGASDAGVSDAR